jgi:transposase-like protein
MDAKTNTLVHAEFDVPEGAITLTRVYETLRGRGVSPNSATIDGNPQQIRYLRWVWPRITLQRCTVHVQRQGLSWCRRHPKRTDARHLREIFLQLSTIEKPEQARRFRSEVRAWERRFGPAIDHATDRGWVFSDLVRARSMLLKALPDLFHYVADPRIPKSTNALESYFSRLKEHYRHHRGLAIHHRDAYFRWYFHFVKGGKTSNTF